MTMKIKTTADLIAHLQTFPPTTALVGAHPNETNEEVEHNYELTKNNFFLNDSNDLVIDVQGITFMHNFQD